LRTMATDYDLCIISLERFSSDVKSPLCPMVGVCGHSFAKQGLQSWYAGRQSDEYHKRKTTIPCVFKCNMERTNRKGNVVKEQVRAFRPTRLVPNYQLCDAVAQINKLKTVLEKESTNMIDAHEFGKADFGACRRCKEEFATDLHIAPGSTDHHPRAPIVGSCGHSSCATCIYDLHLVALSNSHCDNLKNVTCPECSEKNAFHLDHLYANVSLRDSLRHWKELKQQHMVDFKNLYEKKCREVDAMCTYMQKLRELERMKKKFKISNAAAIDVLNGIADTITTLDRTLPLLGKDSLEEKEGEGSCDNEQTP